VNTSQLPLVYTDDDAFHHEVLFGGKIFGFKVGPEQFGHPLPEMSGEITPIGPD
jgi:hypothetical protein